MTTARRDAAARHIRLMHTQLVDAPEEINAMDIHTLEIRRELLQTHWTTFQTEHLGLANLSMNDDAHAVQDRLFTQTQIQYIAVGARYRAAIAEIQRAAAQADPPIGIQAHHIGQGDQAAGAAPPAAQLKFDRVTMKSFDGDYRNWRTFRDQYMTMVHNNSQLDDAMKFYLLNQFLGTEPARVIAGIAQTAANYAGAWNTLNERYENVRVLTDAHFKNFFAMEYMKRENATQLLQMIDTTNVLTRSLPGLDIPVNGWDPILLYCLVTRLDQTTKRAWDLESRDNNQPTLTDFATFLTSRARSIDSNHSEQPTQVRGQFGKSAYRRNSVYAATTTTDQVANGCRMCKGAHPLYRCNEYKALHPKIRSSKAQNWKICFKCLGNHALSEQCALGPCPNCGKQHNKLLCYSSRENSEPTTTTQQPPSQAGGNVIAAATSSNATIHHEPTSFVCNNVSTQFYNTSMLGTVQLRIANCEFDMVPLRALCDSGAQLSLITEHSVQALGLQREKSDLTLTGVGGVDVGRTFGVVKARIAPANAPNFCSFEVKFYVLKRLTTIIPAAPVDVNQWPHLSKLKLADKTCGVPAGIDVLLGVDIWSRIVKQGVIHAQDGSPTAQQTAFGWVVFGTAVQSTKPTCNIVATVVSETTDAERLNAAIERFWLCEETNVPQLRTPQAESCEKIFINHFGRDSNGRYIIRLPFNEKISQIGDSRRTAVQQFKRLEQSLLRDDIKRDHYLKFMAEYEQLGHMTVVPNLKQNERGYYIPHHSVKTAEKFRVVFNGSSPSSTGVSLNDAQLVGEKLQPDLNITVMRFRRHRFAVTADVSKMYRQVLVEPEQRDYQRIVWRKHPTDELREYQLNTVTYGQAAAPHCAIRAMQQCAYDYANEFPVGSAIVLSDFYVDDMLTGGDTIEDIETIHSQTTNLLAKGQFELRKWCSNNWHALTMFQRDESIGELSLNTAEEESTSVLGLKWNPAGDTFFFKIKPMDFTQPPTKRMVVGQIGRLYDPNGYLSASIIIAKVIIQKLWICNIGWDDQVPQDLFTEWKQFADSLPHLENIKIPRWLGTSPVHTIELHGFCDASQTAYGAAIYTRVIEPNGRVTVQLITAKTKVAPIKMTTIPRLELCGAQLLAKLMSMVRDVFNNTINSVIFWTDSEIVLYWVHKQPAQLKMYVGNRVQQIREASIDLGFQWRHVPTATNPADLASRGVMPADLINQQMWWHGPEWLLNSENQWPVNNRTFDLTGESQQSAAAIEERLQVHTVCANTSLMRGPWYAFKTSTECELLTAYSSIVRLENVVATALRFIHNCRERCAAKKRATNFQFGPITEAERVRAQTAIYKLDQQMSFAFDLECCVSNQPLASNSKLIKLNPFVDGNGVLRLGSRIENADIPFNSKFPILLDSRGRIAKLIVQHAHQTLMHGGAQDIIGLVRQNFWIFQLRLLAKRIICECVTCYRHRLQTGHQLMGTLPISRITPAHTFESVGLDFCGPFTLKLSIGRCRTTTKGYVCVFVCMVTRAVHLEVVRDLSSQQFIMALRRFCGRRGDQLNIYSDNGTNFIGAKSILDAWQRVLGDTSQNGALNAKLKMKWHFATPGASHQGGIYEAAVKSMKKHFIRVIGDQPLTYDELETITCQIEGCLNSRPLTPLSDDPNDFTALTPGHFLIGRPLVTLIDQPVDHLPQNRLTRWQLIQQYTQRIWHRWQTDVLQTMVNRPKWFTKQRNFKIGDLVVLVDERLPPTKWKLARIINVFPGADGLVRHVEIQTPENTYRRPITKLGLLLPSAD